MMQYRTLPHGGKQISVLGMGMGSVQGTREEVAALVTEAIDAGVNFFDFAGSSQEPYFGYADAIAGRREQVMLQVHFGAVYDGGKYGWTRELPAIRRTLEWERKLLKTDYVDFGFLHCIDEQADLDAVLSGGLWDEMKALHRNGVIRHLGFSSHDPAIARRLLDTGLVDLFMFSINPAYDYREGQYGIGEVAERSALYRDCARMGVGISVMKPFGGGQLLDEKLSPFRRALTREQCIQYALDRPAVLTVLPGVRNADDLRAVLGYLDAPAEARDYAVLGTFTPQDAQGVCVYCNHCQPCPTGLDVGLINKYYDLARAGDVLADGHYRKLALHAGDCVQCGHCDARCPFHVAQGARMREIAAYFGI